MGVAADRAGQHHQPAHGGRAQGGGRRSREQRVNDHRAQGDTGRRPRQDPPRGSLDDPRQQGDLEAGYHHNMDEPAVDHLLLQGGWQGRPITEDDTQQEGCLRLGQDSIDRAHHGMAQAEQNGMKRVARAGHHPDQPGRLKNAADPLVAQVGAVVELLEAGGFLEPAREDQSIAVVRRLAAVDGGLDSKLTKTGPVCQGRALDRHHQARTSRPGYRIVVDSAGDGYRPAGNFGRKRRGGGKSGASGAAQESGEQDRREDR